MNGILSDPAFVILGMFVGVGVVIGVVAILTMGAIGWRLPKKVSLTLGSMLGAVICIVALYAIEHLAFEDIDGTPCRPADLSGRWQSGTGDFWTFNPDGTIRCEGGCDYRKLGVPRSWAFDRENGFALTFSRVALTGRKDRLYCRVYEKGDEIYFGSDYPGVIALHFDRPGADGQ